MHCRSYDLQLLGVHVPIGGAPATTPTSHAGHVVAASAAADYAIGERQPQRADSWPSLGTSAAQPSPPDGPGRERLVLAPAAAAVSPALQSRPPSSLHTLPPALLTAGAHASGAHAPGSGVPSVQPIDCSALQCQISSSPAGAPGGSFCGMYPDPAAPLVGVGGQAAPAVRPIPYATYHHGDTPPPVVGWELPLHHPHHPGQDARWRGG